MRHFLLRLCSKDSCIRLSINWKLHNDPKRPNKRSKKVVLVLSQEFIEDHGNGTKAYFPGIDKVVTGFVVSQLRGFDPNHNAQYGQPEPVVEWWVPMGDT